MRIREERKAKKEWKYQEAWERRSEVNRERAMIERKCFGYKGFKHIACNSKNVESRREEKVMSSEFVKKNKFKKKKLEKPIYVRNVNGTFNHEGPIKDIVEIKLFYKRHKEKTKIVECDIRDAIVNIP